MRLITMCLLVLLLASSVALADRHRRRGDGHGTYRPVIRDHRTTGVQRARVQRLDRATRAGHATSVDRRVVHRRPLQASQGRFTFHNGATVTYTRPVIRQRYYDHRVRPQPIVERYPAQSGYIWVNGSWSWNGYEWTWTAGYYAPDPSVATYYDDGTYDTYP